ncbi:Penicillin-binding protein 1B [Thalassocella blandensis]|nr:Penicillin-binding protein 1B [Thalassocella blandensis]
MPNTRNSHSSSKSQRKPKSKKATKNSVPPSGRLARWLRILAIVFFVCLCALLAYSVYLNQWVVEKFEGKRFSLPARVFARPMEIFGGATLSADALEEELQRLRYRQVNVVDGVGQYRIRGNEYELMIRPFHFWDEKQAAQHIVLVIRNGRVTKVESATTGENVALARLDPYMIGGIFPGGGEDRELIRIADVPRDVINALIAVEDKRFFDHHGVDPKAILRAVSSLFFADRVQGGSTITQQLVKNFFLTSERTVQRKVTEMIMAVLLEYHYSKADILETYINEVFLGQDGDRAIHGLALASQFYFAKDLEHIKLQEAALLIGMLKGPNYYNPRRNPERALKRRNLVLQEMFDQGVITEQAFASAKSSSLGVSAKPNLGQSLYPAFMQLVVRQLTQDYREEDLRSEGLRIFTSLDPHIQHIAEQGVQRRLNTLEKAYKLKSGLLEAAMVVADVNSGEVSAVVGGRKPRYKGFNRALDASRQIGSLIKPALYLTALEQGYSLTSPLDDSEFVWQERGTEDWKPQNYDGTYHGRVALWQAFANSYNVAAARLGTELGVDKVMRSVQRLGVDKTLPGYASGLLGTVHLTPFEVAQMYASFASGGFKTPFRAIRDVTTKSGEPLNRYNVKVEPVIDPKINYLTVVAMQQVVKHGTAKSLSRYVNPEFAIAGKTGTTDDSRDSWFAGFSGNLLAVTWIGNDANQSIRLTGATGALTVWGEVMQHINMQALDLPKPEGVVMLPVDLQSGFLHTENCDEAFKLPFVLAFLQESDQACLNHKDNKIKRWFKKIFNN